MSLTDNLRRAIRRCHLRPESRAAAPSRGLEPWALQFLPHYFPIALSAFHRWLTAELDTVRRHRGTKLNVLAPRGAAKSTWSTLAEPLYDAVHGIEPFIVITSDTGGQAEGYLRTIRDELENNDALREDYPLACGKGPIWRDNHIRLRNGVEIQAIGTGSKIRGRKAGPNRPSLLIIDDPQNKDHIVSALQRERSWEWLTKDVCNAGSPETNIIVLGTALHQGAIVCRLQQTPGWRSKVFKAIDPMPSRMDLWATWEELYRDYDKVDGEREAVARAFYDGKREEMDAGAVLLWPEREPLYSLMELRASVGASAFASEKQNDPVDPSLCEWPASYFERPGFWFDEWPEGLEVKVLALDPSLGNDRKDGDYGAYVRYGRDAQKIEYVEADLRRMNAEDLVEVGIEHLREFRPEAFAVEVNNFQQLLIAPFRAASEFHRVDLPVVGVNNAKPSKEVRIRRLGGSLAQGRMRFKARSAGTKLLVEQLKLFPHGEHDDGPDSLEIARRVAVELWNGSQVPPQQRVKLR